MHKVPIAPNRLAALNTIGNVMNSEPPTPPTAALSCSHTPTMLNTKYTMHTHRIHATNPANDKANAVRKTDTGDTLRTVTLRLDI